MAFRRVVRLMFSPRYLLVTNTVSSGLLMGVGDWATQKTVLTQNSDTSAGTATDWRRIGTMTVVGLLFGPLNHYWYKYLDQFLPGTNHATVMRKLLVEQALGSPVFTGYFFFTVGLVEGDTLKECWKELREKFLAVFVVDCIAWPIIQIFNFYFVPSFLRVTYVNVATIAYNAFLSFIKYEHNSRPAAILCKENE